MTASGLPPRGVFVAVVGLNDGTAEVGLVVDGTPTTMLPADARALAVALLSTADYVEHPETIPPEMTKRPSAEIDAATLIADAERAMRLRRQ
jgi:hypothetical protein